MRLTPLLALASFVACSDPSEPGEPVALTPHALEGRWVRFQVVLATVTAPRVSDTTEISENGEIYQFTSSGGVEYFCRCPGLGGVPNYTSYSIAGDTLWLHQVGGGSHPQLAEVTTHRLILRSIGTFQVDITGDDAPEDVTVTSAYRRE